MYYWFSYLSSVLPEVNVTCTFGVVVIVAWFVRASPEDATLEMAEDIRSHLIPK